MGIEHTLRCNRIAIGEQHDSEVSRLPNGMLSRFGCGCVVKVHTIILLSGATILS
jgi:hypothetical protein